MASIKPIRALKAFIEAPKLTRFELALDCNSRYELCEIVTRPAARRISRR
jgi:hypothetical protein